MKKILFIILFFLSLTLITNLKTKAYVNDNEYYINNEPIQEFRAVWFSHFINDASEYKDKESYIEELTKDLDLLKSMNINAILFHVRTHNNALYDSELNPVGKWYKNVDFSEFDPLSWLIDEAHKRGIEFHGWMNPYRVGSLSDSVTVSDYVNNYKDYKDNPASSIDNLLYNDETVILNPGLPVVKEFIVDTIKEFVRKYDVDGIHFDDYFYIPNINDEYAYNLYKEDNEELADFERRMVDELIYDIHESLKEYNINNNKAIVFGISPSGAYNGINERQEVIYDDNFNLISPVGEYSDTSHGGHGNNYLRCDTKKWIDNEWIDYIMPLRYGYLGESSYTYEDFTDWWSLVTHYKKTNLFFGVGSSYCMTQTRGWNEDSDLEDILAFYRKYQEVSGICYFSFKALVYESKQIEDFKKANNKVNRTFIPSAYYENLDYVKSVNITDLKYTDGVLSWDKIDSARGYLVYEVPNGKIFDYEKTKYLRCYISDNYLNIECKDNYKYYVSAVNKANKISDPIPLDDYDTLENYYSYFNELREMQNYNEFKHYYDLVMNNLILNSDLMIRFIYEINLDQKSPNFSNYVFVNERIQTYEDMERSFNKLLDKIDLHLYNGFNLPSECGEYKIEYSSDSDLIDINNQEIKANNYGWLNIDLDIKISNKFGDEIITRKIANIGRLSNNGHYLMYRNCSGTMFTGDYDDTGKSFIGYSGYALCYNHYYLFLASSNVLDITSENIPSYGKPSCGVVYTNKTNDTITWETSDIEVKFSEHGYIIFNNGVILECGESIKGVSSVTLNPGDSLFIPKNLDNSIKNNQILRFSDNSGSCYLINNDEFLSILTIDEEIEKVIVSHDLELLEKLSTDINNMDERVKNLLTNLNYLEMEIKKLSKEKELSKGKEELCNYIESFSIENEEGNELLNNIKTNAYALIDKCDDISELDDIKYRFDLVYNTLLNKYSTYPTPREETETPEPTDVPIEVTEPSEPDEPKESTKKKSGCKNTLSLFSIFTVFGLVIVFRKKQ